MSAKAARMALIGHDPDTALRPGAAGLHLHADDAAVDLVVLARVAVHPQYVVEGMLTHCQCTTCRRVERALMRVAEDSEQGRDHALAETAMAMRQVTVVVADLDRTVHERDAADARDRALIHQWREHAAIERADACAPRPMSPALRSVRNHRGQVYDACADQLAAIRPAPGSASSGPVGVSRKPY